MIDVATFEKRIIECGYVLDPVEVHHEFVDGMHGRKLDFDKIKNERGARQPLYDEWLAITETFIRQQYEERLPDMLLGVANGTNRIALDVAPRLGRNTLGLISRKDRQDGRTLYLGQRSLEVMIDRKPRLVLVVEDVSTTGSSSVQVARRALEAGAQAVEVVTTWQRTERLPYLEESGIAYRAIIKHILPTFKPEDCQTDPQGLCATGSRLINYNSR